MSTMNLPISPLMGLALTLGLVMLGGCRPGRPVLNDPTSPQIPESPVIAPPASRQAEAPAAEPKTNESPLVVTLATDKTSYDRDDAIQFTITLHNKSKEQQNLLFNSGQIFDINATPEGKTEPAWVWSDGKMFTRALRNVKMEPDQKQTFTATWDQTGSNGAVVARGSYVVQARITANGGISSAPLTLKLTD